MTTTEVVALRRRHFSHAAASVRRANYRLQHVDDLAAVNNHSALVA